MKFLVLLPLFAGLLVSGCGEKSPKEEAAAVEPLGDSAIDKALKEAVDDKSLTRFYPGLYYRDNKPYSGWVKRIYDSGQVEMLGKAKDGKTDGLQTLWHENGQKKGELTYRDGRVDGPTTVWHENGQKSSEVTFKDGKPDGPYTRWYENGQKKAEEIWKDGEEVSAKYWNSKGEEVESLEEAVK